MRNGKVKIVILGVAGSNPVGRPILIRNRSGTDRTKGRPRSEILVLTLPTLEVGGQVVR